MDPARYESAVLAAWGITPDQHLARSWAQAYLSLTEQVTTGTRPSATLQDPDHALVADLIHSARTHRIATQLMLRHALHPTHIVELGSGIGPVALASGARHATLLDADPRPLERATRVAALLEAVPPTTKTSSLRDAALPSGDLIALPFVLNEVERQGIDPAPLVRRCLAQTTTGGHVLILEPGTPAAAARLQRLRNAFLDSVVAPCPHRDACPLAAPDPDWCHFAHDAPLGPWAKRIGELAHRRPEQSTYTYLLLARAPNAPPGGARVLSVVRSERAKLRVYVCAAARYEAWTALRRQPAYEAMNRLVPGTRLDLPAKMDRRGDGVRIESPADLIPVSG